ncbi:hypothetical protein WFK86_10575, partial [Yersinia enterocolitica]|uniref:hypothetical protein n=3 Tax=Yersinia enterocolitica TaxID=630 RepID=UPI001C10B322
FHYPWRGRFTLLPILSLQVASARFVSSLSWHLLPAFLYQSHLIYFLTHYKKSLSVWFSIAYGK